MHAFEEMKILTQKVRQIVDNATNDGVELNDGNVVDLIVDQLTDDELFHNVSPGSVRFAISQAGFAKRFPKAIRK